VVTCVSRFDNVFVVNISNIKYVGTVLCKFIFFFRLLEEVADYDKRIQASSLLFSKLNPSFFYSKELFKSIFRIRICEKNMAIGYGSNIFWELDPNPAFSVP